MLEDIHKMRLPDVDLDEFDKISEKNRMERLRFIDQYTEWLKKTPDREWSAQQKDLMD